MHWISPNVFPILGLTVICIFSSASDDVPERSNIINKIKTNSQKGAPVSVIFL